MGGKGCSDAEAGADTESHNEERRDSAGLAPTANTQAQVKAQTHGLGTGDIGVYCQQGHTMQARSSRELSLKADRANCHRCGGQIAATDFSYVCKACNCSLCLPCATLAQSSGLGSVADIGRAVNSVK